MNSFSCRLPISTSLSCSEVLSCSFVWTIFLCCLILFKFLFVFLMYVVGEGNGTPLQYSCLENPMDGGAWWAAVHAVAKSWTRLSDFPFTFHFHALEKEMATHSSVLAWRIPWTEKPGRLQSMGSWRVGHNWATSLSLSTFMHWRRKWQPSPAFLPGESQGWGSLVGCCLWGRTESDTTEAT